MRGFPPSVYVVVDGGNLRRVRSSGFRAQGSGCGIWGVGFRGRGVGLRGERARGRRGERVRVEGVGCGVEGPGLRCRVSQLEVLGEGYLNLRFQV